MLRLAIIIARYAACLPLANSDAISESVAAFSLPNSHLNTLYTARTANKY